MFEGGTAVQARDFEQSVDAELFVLDIQSVAQTYSFRITTSGAVRTTCSKLQSNFKVVILLGQKQMHRNVDTHLKLQI